MSIGKYRSYCKTHSYKDPYEAEKGKIKRETNRFLKAENKIKNTLNLNTYYTVDVEDELFDQLQKHMTVYKKEKGNAKTHKKRLKNFQKHI